LSSKESWNNFKNHPRRSKVIQIVVSMHGEAQAPEESDEKYIAKRVKTPPKSTSTQSLRLFRPFSHPSSFEILSPASLQPQRSMERFGNFLGQLARDWAIKTSF
jgi:hypothetical protein